MNRPSIPNINPQNIPTYGEGYIPPEKRIRLNGDLLVDLASIPSSQFHTSAELLKLGLGLLGTANDVWQTGDSRIKADKTIGNMFTGVNKVQDLAEEAFYNWALSHTKNNPAIKYNTNSYRNKAVDGIQQFSGFGNNALHWVWDKANLIGSILGQDNFVKNSIDLERATENYLLKGINEKDPRQVNNYNIGKGIGNIYMDTLAFLLGNKYLGNPVINKAKKLTNNNILVDNILTRNILNAIPQVPVWRAMATAPNTDTRLIGPYKDIFSDKDFIKAWQNEAMHSWYDTYEKPYGRKTPLDWKGVSFTSEKNPNKGKNKFNPGTLWNIGAGTYKNRQNTLLDYTNPENLWYLGTSSSTRNLHK